MEERKIINEFSQLKRVQLDDELMQKIKNIQPSAPVIDMNGSAWIRAIAAVLVLNAICLGLYFGTSSIDESETSTNAIYYTSNVNIYGYE